MQTIFLLCCTGHVQSIPRRTTISSELPPLPLLTTRGKMYHKAWSLIRVPPNHDDRSSEEKVRYSLAEGTQKSRKPHKPMKKKKDAAERNGWRVRRHGVRDVVRTSKQAGAGKKA